MEDSKVEVYECAAGFKALAGCLYSEVLLFRVRVSYWEREKDEKLEYINQTIVNAVTKKQRKYSHHDGM